ncbi:MAG TPA: hypothetical protein VMY76_11525 [Gemmatimonadales bacterium]|nr:hypothetical protein [Gemmatimonadales bacterium]
MRRAKTSARGYTSGDPAEARLRLPRPSPLTTMKPATDYIRHAARLARKLQMDAAMGSTPQPDAEFYKVLSKALDEIAAGLDQVSRTE